MISAETVQNLQKIRDKHKAALSSRTREAKRKAAAELTKVNNTVKESARADKRNYLGELAERAEEAASYGDSQTLYDTIRRISGNFGKPDVPVKDKDGNFIPGKQRQKERWTEHLEELLNRTPPQINQILSQQRKIWRLTVKSQT